MALHLTTNAATQAWDDLAERLERFIATWEASGEPTIVEYLPVEPPAHRRFVLIELIKVDLEQRTTRKRAKRLEDYTREFPELLEDGEPPCDLIYEEFHIRRVAGEGVTSADYYSRFPRSAEALRRLMGTEEVTATTQLVPSKKIESFTAGSRLDDFDLIVELGKGAFGSVFLARQVSMQRMVALKVSADKGNEPQTLAQLDHPNIIRVFDQRRLPGQRLRLLYMQYAAGGTLADVVKKVLETPPAARTGAILTAAVSSSVERGGVLGDSNSAWTRRLANASWPETVCRLGVQLAQALDYAHKHGILHRDVKPANVLLAADGSPKLADFNISFCSQLEGATPAAYFGGSVAYMSPEQLDAVNPTNSCKPDDLDGRSDLYALAVLLWELLHGARPFAEDEITGTWTRMLEKMAQQRRSELPFSPAITRDAVTVRLEHALRKALSPAPNDRPADGTVMARELLLCLNPRAWDLVNDLKSGWRNWARRRPTLALLPMVMPPFAIASVFNYYFNNHCFIERQTPNVQQTFWNMVIPVNGIFFPLGVFFIGYFALPVTQTLRDLAKHRGPSVERLQFARGRSLILGHLIANVGLALWLIAGVIFPAGMHWSWPLEFDALIGWPHFLLSMGLCGMISCCFPFLATTWLTVRVFFPALLASTAPEPGEQRQLMALSRQAFRYVAMSAVVPMIATVLMLFGNAKNDPEYQNYTMVMIIGGIFGFGAAYAMYQRIREDLMALSVVTRPPDMIGTTTDTVETI